MIKVVCGVIFKCDKYLITKRGDVMYYGKWEFPGGKVLKNEGIFDAIKREILEELNIKIKPQEEVLRYEFDKYYLIFIKCKFNDVENSIILSEHLEYKWVRKEDFNKYDFMDGDIKFIKHVLK